jgi:uncharacterized protein (DUF983 family)
MNDDTKPVVDDLTFMENVLEALENGYDRLCAHCGTGVYDGFEIHEKACPEFVAAYHEHVLE